MEFTVMDSFHKNNKKNIIITTVWVVVLAASSLLINLRWDPIFQYLESDSGVFAYVGSSILNGQLPYRDVWEQKPPIGFYLNALALALFGHSPWAIWWFNVIWIALTTIVFFLLIRKMMGLITGCLASLFFLAGVMLPEIFQGGNLMEVYGLLPQVLIIWATYQFFSKRKEGWIFAAGLLTGIAFMTKQTTIALGISSFLVVFFNSLLDRQFKQGLLRLLFFVGGFIIFPFLAVVYWASFGALNDFMDAVLLHSLTYVGEKTSSLRTFAHEFKVTLLQVLPKILISRLYYLSIGVFILYSIENFRWYYARIKQTGSRAQNEINPIELTLAAIFIAIPLEIFFASLGGRNFGHYFLTLVPAGATIAAYITWKTLESIRVILGNKTRFSPTMVGWWLLFVFSAGWLVTAIYTGAPTANHLSTITKIFSDQYDLAETEKFIIENTKPNDKVLVWHVHTGTNFVTKTRAGLKVLFPMNLFIPDKQGYSKLDSFISDFQNDPPKLILIQKPNSAGLPFVDVNLKEFCQPWCLSEIETALRDPAVYTKMEIFQNLFFEKYSLKKKIYDWYIYGLKN